jgi:16S rRNA (cytosine967-C5)-methyltransferase
VKTIIGDVSKFQELRQKLNNTLFDKIVVDPPCSNTGVLRKRIEARWRLNVSDFKRLAGLQIEILRNASQFLKHGGLLLYETCSIDPEENQYVISGFLESNPDFNLIKQQLFFPTTPQASDGGFGALLKRVT